MPASLALRFAALCSIAAAAGCSQNQAPPASQPAGAPAPVSAPPPTASSPTRPEPGRLPEDPIAGKRSTLQWREHMQEEEEERQAVFDRNRLKEHAATLKLIAGARAQLDRARTKAAATKARADMTRRVAELERRVHAIDPWGVNSRVLPDYAALSASLAGPYADAKLAALAGDSGSLDEVRADFDQHMLRIADWLEEVRAGEHEHEREHARERKHERD